PVVETANTSCGRAPTFAIASRVASPKRRHTSTVSRSYPNPAVIRCCHRRHVVTESRDTTSRSKQQPFLPPRSSPIKYCATYFLPVEEIRQFKSLLSQSEVKCPAIVIDAALSKQCNPSLPLFPFAFLRIFELQNEEIPDSRAQVART